MHFSFRDEDGRNAAYDEHGIGGSSPVAQQFIAGVLRHMRAITALVAPSPVSYYRLGPHHWSCGYASFGIQNREAALRVLANFDVLYIGGGNARLIQTVLPSDVRIISNDAGITGGVKLWGPALDEAFAGAALSPGADRPV